MNDVLATIGEDLQRAVRRRAARRHRRRLALTATLCAAGLATVTGAVAGDVDPLSLMHDADPLGPPAHDVQRIDLTVDGRTDIWRVVLYRSEEGALCMIVPVDRRRPKSIACGDGLALASAARTRRAGLMLARPYGPAHGRRLITGAVAADVDRVWVTDGTGRRYPATLSSDTIAVPVKARGNGWFPAPRRPAADLPRRLVLRGYAVELPLAPGAVLGEPRVRFHLHRADGTVRTAVWPSYSG